MYLQFSVELSTHGVRLSGSRLSVSEAGGHAAFEDVLDERPGGVSGKRNGMTQQKYLQCKTNINEFNGVWSGGEKWKTISLSNIYAKLL